MEAGEEPPDENMQAGDGGAGGASLEAGILCDGLGAYLVLVAVSALKAGSHCGLSRW